MTKSSRALDNGTPSRSGERERERDSEGKRERERPGREPKKPLYHTQAGYCCLFTGLHLGPLYHSIRTAFTPHSREKGPSIKLKTSRCHWRAHRKRPTVLSLLSFLSLSSCCCCSGLCEGERESEREEESKQQRSFVNTRASLSLSLSFLSLCSLFFSSSLSITFERKSASTILQCCRWSELWLS